MFGALPRSFLIILVSVMVVACLNVGRSGNDDESLSEKTDLNINETVQHAANIKPTPTSTPRPTPVTVRTAHRVEPAVDFGLKLFTGEEIQLSEFIGSVVVLNFWASWCPPCIDEMPSFETIYQEYKDAGVLFVGVAVSDTETRAGSLANQLGITYPLGLDPGHIATVYHVTTMPTTFFIDRDGNVSRKLQGVVNEGALRFFLNSRIN